MMNFSNRQNDRNWQYIYIISERLKLTSAGAYIAVCTLKKSCITGISEDEDTQSHYLDLLMARLLVYHDLEKLNCDN